MINARDLLTEACVAQKCDSTVCVAALQQIFSKELSWIMFEYGSLILIQPNDDGTLFTEEQLRTRALDLLEKYGKVINYIDSITSTELPKFLVASTYSYCKGRARRDFEWLQFVNICTSW